MSRQGLARWPTAKRALVSLVWPVVIRWARYPYYLYPQVERAKAPVPGPVSRLPVRRAAGRP